MQGLSCSTLRSGQFIPSQVTYMHSMEAQNFTEVFVRQRKRTKDIARARTRELKQESYRPRGRELELDYEKVKGE